MNYPIKLMLFFALLFHLVMIDLDFFDGDIEDPDLSGEMQGPLGITHSQLMI